MSAYKGRELRGRILATFLKGDLIFDFEDSSVIENCNNGRLMKRKEFIESIEKCVIVK